MQEFLFRRLAQTLLALFALSILTFLLLRTERSTAHDTYVAPIEACPGACYTYEDPPLALQYPLYVKYTFQGDWDKAWGLGRNLSGRRDYGDGDIVLDRLPATLRLASLALALSLALGIALGTLAAIHKGSAFDRSARMMISFGQSMPIFWLGGMLLWTFSIHLAWLPTGSREGFSDMFLPAITLAWLPTVVLAKFTRDALLSALESDYVKLARIKGLTEWKIIWKHCLRNVAVSPLISFGLIGGAFMTSLVLTEAIFNWPGAGLLTLQSISAIGYHPMLSGLVLFLGGGFILCHLAVDVLRAFLDPRIRYSESTYLNHQVAPGR